MVIVAILPLMNEFVSHYVIDNVSARWLLYNRTNVIFIDCADVDVKFEDNDGTWILGSSISVGRLESK